MSKNLTHEASSSKDVPSRVAKLEAGGNYGRGRTQRKTRFGVVFGTKRCTLQFVGRNRMLGGMRGYTKNGAMAKADRMCAEGRGN